jgi:DNA-binding NarL/FixJ family response regulator
MKEIRIIIAESSDIMLNGITAMLDGRPEITVTGKAYSYGTLSKLLENNPDDIVLLGPILTEKYPHELKEELKGDFPTARIVEIELKDEPASIIDKIILATSA